MNGEKNKKKIQKPERIVSKLHRLTQQFSTIECKKVIQHNFCSSLNFQLDSQRIILCPYYFCLLSFKFYFECFKSQNKCRSSHLRQLKFWDPCPWLRKLNKTV